MSATAVSPPLSLVKAAHRLNPAIDLEVDVVAVARAAGASTRAEWEAGTLTDVVVNDKGEARLAEGTPLTVFSSGGAHTDATTPFHLNESTPLNIHEKLWLDFWPDPSQIGPSGFTLHSFDVVLGRKRGSAVFGPGVGVLPSNGKFIIEVARLDEHWNRESLGSRIEIRADTVANNGSLVSIDFRARDRQLAIFTGRMRTRTGSGRDAGGAERVVDFTLEGDRKVSHLVVPMGFSIGISAVGTNRHAAWVGMLPTPTYPGFDDDDFWRASTGGRDCGPYDPSGSVSALDVNRNPGSGYLSTGAAPGYGAIDTATLSTGGIPYGQWGISREVAEPNGQHSPAVAGWNQPWHLVRAVSYA